jgi:MFS family permease
MPRSEAPRAWSAGLCVALTRFLALSKTPWDADEGLFISALRHYDVVQHHPHPPGFPLFIAAAKLFSFAGLDAFHALQYVSLIASIAIVPAMLFLGRELGLSQRVSWIAAIFLAFFPNVWYFGGTALSDVPSMTLSIVVIALLLRGARSDASYYSGAVLLGIAAGFRPQTLLIAIVPALIAMARGRRILRVFAFGAIVIAIVVGSYAAAAHFSGGWAKYRQSLAEHEEYIAQNDSFRAPLRPPMWELFDNFFIRPYDAPLINAIVTLLAAASVIVSVARRRRSMLILIATFAPFCIAAWMLLDRFSTSRFSIGYAPLFAFLAADGVEIVFARWPRIAIAAAAIFAAIMLIWTWPAIAIVHRTDSPPVAALDWIRRHDRVAYIYDSMKPLADALLAERKHVTLEKGSPPLTGAMREGDVYLLEGVSRIPGAVVFERPRTRIASIARSTRYFEASIVPIRQFIEFIDGWYPKEESWRWMGSRGVIHLPPRLARMRVVLRMYVPLDALGKPPTLTITFNGNVIDRIVAKEETLERTYDVNAITTAPNELVIETDEVVNPAKRGLNADTRDLGVRLNAVEWLSR